MLMTIVERLGHTKVLPSTLTWYCGVRERVVMVMVASSRTTMGRIVSEWGESGVSARHAVVGSMMGPPALRL